MTADEIKRIKSGLGRAIVKAPENLILRDFEKTILTVEKFYNALEEISKHPACSDSCGAVLRAKEALKVILMGSR